MGYVPPVKIHKGPDHIFNQGLLEQRVVLCQDGIGNWFIFLDQAKPTQKDTFSFHLRVEATVSHRYATAVPRCEFWRHLVTSLALHWSDENGCDIGLHGADELVQASTHISGAWSAERAMASQDQPLARAQLAHIKWWGQPQYLAGKGHGRGTMGRCGCESHLGICQGKHWLKRCGDTGENVVEALLGSGAPGDMRGVEGAPGVEPTAEDTEVRPTWESTGVYNPRKIKRRDRALDQLCRPANHIFRSSRRPKVDVRRIQCMIRLEHSRGVGNIGVERRDAPAKLPLAARSCWGLEVSGNTV